MGQRGTAKLQVVLTLPGTNDSKFPRKNGAKTGATFAGGKFYFI